MKTADLRAAAEEMMARVPVTVRPGTTRLSVIEALPPAGNIGIELGVAAGGLAARMVRSGRFAHYFGVDAYDDLHNIREYKKALAAVGLVSECRLLRMTFDQALDLFPDRHFDFIYVDGYAHTGEEGGRTLRDWFPKLKPGGVMAGDDYALADWPLVVWAVNDFVAQLGVGLNVTDRVTDEPYAKYPSWWFVKPEGVDDRALRLTPELVVLADAAREAVARARRKKLQARRAAARAQR